MKRRIAMWSVLVGLTLALSAITGCSQGELEDAECQSDEECAEEEICDDTVGTCEVIRDQTDGSDGGDDNGDDDVSPPGGGGDNGDNGDSGDSGGDDDDVTPPAPPCGEAFADCDVAQGEEQGEFWCVETSDEDGTGICLPGCDDPGEPSSCNAESYCWELEDLDEPACLPSMCQGDDDCDGGTCVMMANSYGECVEDGPGAVGDSCADGIGGECAEGLVCDAGEAQSGTCRTVCDPWLGTGCESQQVCQFYFERSGLCTDDVTSYGDEVYDLCSPAGSWCGDAMYCYDFGDDSACLEYCRPGRGDCDDIVIEDEFGQPETVEMTCHNHMFPGVDTFGTCEPGCDVDSDCPETMDCHEGLCRIPCTDPVTDCCAEDSPDCGAECDAQGYCS